MMKSLQSLQKRLTLFLLLPVAVMLFAVGLVGFRYARQKMLDQWREAAILRLERAAHQVDMRLNRPKQWLEIFSSQAGGNRNAQARSTILQALENLDGVARVSLTWYQADEPAGMNRSRAGECMEMGSHMLHSSMRDFHHARVTLPRYDAAADHETVTLISELEDEVGHPLGQLAVVLRFEYLMKGILDAQLWQPHQAFLLADGGRVLAGSLPQRNTLPFGQERRIEQETLRRMAAGDSGTVMGPGYPPKEISGFYRLKEAPWTLVVIAPGKVILSPIYQFRNTYFTIGTVIILLILVFIRVVGSRTVAAIQAVSQAARGIAEGRFGSPLPVTSRDEIGELTKSFNTMVAQLEDRLRLKRALDLAMELQQTLLPAAAVRCGTLDVAGKSLYCDETGGDYYDFFDFPELGPGRMGVAVGDVVGHGLDAALLMTTARAMLRSRLTQPGSLAQSVADVNRLLCRDTAKSGGFMTLFVALLDGAARRVTWVRAGHDPAMVYDPGNDTFHQLRGTGMALGVDPQTGCSENRFEPLQAGQVLLIGTDGIWDTRNPADAVFGKQRLQQILRAQHTRGAREIITAIVDALADFRQGAPQEDDVTLVIVKA